MSSSEERSPDRRRGDRTGDEILALRVVSSTRKQYDFILARISRWLADNHPTMIEDGQIKLPIPVNICKGIMSHSSIKRDRRGIELQPRQFNSHATISGVQCAINYLYKEKNVPMATELKKMLSGSSYTLMSFSKQCIHRVQCRI